LNTALEQCTITRKIIHLFYVDNFKLVGKQEEELQKRVQTAKIFSGDSYIYSYLILATRLYSKKEN
jgi:hypothetical protein